jgi:Tfp pilus assembly protein PilF
MVIIRAVLFSVFFIILASGLSFGQSELDRAYSLLSQGDTSSAVAIFENHVYSNPSDTQIQLQLAYIYNNKKDYPKAIEYFQNVTKYSTDASVVEDARKSISYLQSFTVDNALLEAAYKSLNQGDTLLAVSLFEQHVKNHPEATNVYLQLGYLYNSKRNYPKALEYFQLVESRSGNIDEIVSAKKSIIVLNQQMGTGNVTFSGTANPVLDEAYKKLNGGDRTGAIALFEQHVKSNPSDTKIHMQLGYLYADKKDFTKAREHFNYVKSNSTSASERSQATSSLNVLNNNNVRLSSRSSVELYFYNNYDTFQENYISNFLGKYNFMLAKSFYTGVYTDVYLDSRSRPDLIFNDRYAEVGAFVRFAPISMLSLEVRGGYVRQIDRKLDKFNFKPILTFANRFGNPPAFRNANTKREHFYLDTYAAALYDHKYENFFGQLTLREALRFLTGGYSHVDFYLKQQGAVDSEKLDFNNYAEFGGGISYAPNIRFFPELFVEATNKVYFAQNTTNTFQVKLGFLLTYYSPL